MLIRLPLWKGKSLEMSMWNPVYALVPIVLLVLAPTLVVFASLTTAIALTLMSLRGLAVLSQVVWVISAAWMRAKFESTYPSRPEIRKSTPKIAPKTSPNTSPRYKHHVRSFVPSPAVSEESLDSNPGAPRIPDATSSYTTNDLGRDYEGVGGWRTAGDDDEEALWMNMNSRLQLPTDNGINGLRNQRNLTAGGSPLRQRAPSPEAIRQSPVQSRARTPVRFVLDETEGYFPTHTDKALRPLSSVSSPSKHHARRKSGSGSSSSSTISGMPKIVKEHGT